MNANYMFRSTSRNRHMMVWHCLHIYSLCANKETEIKDKARSGSCSISHAKQSLEGSVLPWGCASIVIRPQNETYLIMCNYDISDAHQRVMHTVPSNAGRPLSAWLWGQEQYFDSGINASLPSFERGNCKIFNTGCSMIDQGSPKRTCIAVSSWPIVRSTASDVVETEVLSDAGVSHPAKAAKD